MPMFGRLSALRPPPSLGGDGTPLERSGDCASFAFPQVARAADAVNPYSCSAALSSPVRLVPARCDRPRCGRRPCQPARAAAASRPTDPTCRPSLLVARKVRDRHGQRRAHGGRVARLRASACPDRSPGRNRDHLVVNRLPHPLARQRNEGEASRGGSALLDRAKEPEETRRHHVLDSRPRPPTNAWCDIVHQAPCRCRGQACCSEVTRCRLLLALFPLGPVDAARLRPDYLMSAWSRAREAAEEDVMQLVTGSAAAERRLGPLARTGVVGPWD